MKNVLVTGADGFIGRHLVAELLQNNIKVYALVYIKNHCYINNNDDNLIIIEMDLSNKIDDINNLPNNIDVMYHLAWIGVNANVRDDIDIQVKNIQMSINCLNLAQKYNIKRVIFPGSTNEYLYYGKPLNKNALPSPSNAYGAIKIAVRYIAENIAKKKGIEFIYVIISGIYAADRKDNNVIFYTIDKLLHKEKPSLTKLEQLWDYVYIDDVINGLVKVAEKGKKNMVYVIGHGDNIPLNKYIEIIHNKIDNTLPLGIGEIEYNSDRIPCSCVDLTDIINDTGYRPQVSFEEGIERVIKKMQTEL